MFYNIADTKTKRATGLGYGRRFDSLLNVATLNSPSPNRYTLDSQFIKDQKTRAFSFGLSRDHFKKVFIKENLLPDSSVPGPGQYDHSVTLAQMKGIQYTLRPKTSKDSSFQNHTRGFPGPGTYEMSATEDKNGFCYVSKFKSSTGTKFNMISPGNHTASQRIDVNLMRRSLQVPGPGNYDNHEKLKMDPRGSYQFSKWRSSGAPIFSRSNRNTNLETSVTRKSKLCNKHDPTLYSHPWSRHLSHPIRIRLRRRL